MTRRRPSYARPSSRSGPRRATCRERVALIDSKHELHLTVDCGPIDTPVPHPCSRGAPSMVLLPSYPEFYPLLVGLMALSGLALPIMMWWSERR
jgi:hypothetical protein